MHARKNVHGVHKRKHIHDIACSRDREQMERNIDRYSDNYIVAAAAATTSINKKRDAHTNIHSAKMIVFASWANGTPPSDSMIPI